MKKTILATLMMAASLTKGFSAETPDIHDSFTYGTIGVGPFPLPLISFGVGHRHMMNEGFAADVNLNVATLIFINSLRGSVSGLKYFNEKPTSRGYVGLGATGGGIHIKQCGWTGYVAPLFTVGREYITCRGSKQFIQVETAYPTFSTEGTNKDIPMVALRWGFAF